jgi:hypothetical protein
MELRSMAETQLVPKLLDLNKRLFKHFKMLLFWSAKWHAENGEGEIEFHQEVLHCIAVLDDLSLGFKICLVVDRKEVGFDVFEDWLCTRHQKATMHAIECSSVVCATVDFVF